MIEIGKALTILVKPPRPNTIGLLYSDTFGCNQLNLVNFAPTAIASFHHRKTLKYQQLWERTVSGTSLKIQESVGNFVISKTLNQGVN